MDVGFIDLGRMGQAMARTSSRRAIASLYTIARVAVPKSCGTKVRKSLTARPVPASGEIVVTMLADDDAVEEVVLGSGRIIGALRQDAIDLSMSTISVALSEELTEAHYAARQYFLTAPVFGL